MHKNFLKIVLITVIERIKDKNFLHHNRLCNKEGIHYTLALVHIWIFSVEIENKQIMNINENNINNNYYSMNKNSLS